MYYLQSRYYDAKICRFINADGALYHSILGYNLFVYCENNPVNYYDSTGEFCVAIMDDDGNPLNDWLLEGAGGGGAKAGYYGPGTSYHNYQVRMGTAAYDARLGGYHSTGLSSAMVNLNYYCVSGAVTVTDSMATGNVGKVSYSHKALTTHTNAESKKFSADQDAVLQLAKGYRKTGISLSEANILWQWANEYGLTGNRYHGPKYDSYLGGSQLHIKINGMHINIFDQ